MDEKQKAALKTAFDVLVDADLVEVSFLHLGLKNPIVKKNLRSENQSQDDRDRPKQNE